MSGFFSSLIWFPKASLFIAIVSTELVPSHFLFVFVCLPPSWYVSWHCKLILDNYYFSMLLCNSHDTYSALTLSCKMHKALDIFFWRYLHIFMSFIFVYIIYFFDCKMCILFSLILQLCILFSLVMRFCIYSVIL